MKTLGMIIGTFLLSAIYLFHDVNPMISYSMVGGISTWEFGKWVYNKNEM